MQTYQTLIVADSTRMLEIKDESIDLIVTSPPYFNAPHDYKNMFSDYSQYLNFINKFSKESYRVLKKGRIVSIVIDDMLIDGKRYPIVSDLINIFIKNNFKFRENIIWKKPDGYALRSKRSGIFAQNPYPMYYYPDNVFENILVFQKDKYKFNRSSKNFEASKLPKNERKNILTNLWEIPNISPRDILNKNIAAFPEEIPSRLIKLYSYKGETVLDPFTGSGTTLKIARELGRNSIGYEIQNNLVIIIEEKLSFSENLKIIYRNR